MGVLLMKWKDFPQATREAIRRMHTAIESEVDHIGPRSELALAQYEEDHDPLDELPTNAVLSEWVLVMAWSNLEDGETWTTAISSENLPNYRHNGLLRMHLAE